MSRGGPVLGTVTVGQSPRVDVIPELAALLPGVAFREAGALDRDDPTTLARLAAEPHGPLLVTRLRDGAEIRIGEEDVLPRVRACVERLGQETDAILLLCSGPFPLLASPVPLLYPDRLLTHFVAAVWDGPALGVLTPGEPQIPWQTARWRAALGDAGAAGLAIAAASPYAPDWRPGLDAACDALAAAHPALVVMDCLGYTAAMRARVRERLTCPVVVARSVLARAAAELLGLSG